MSTVSIRAEEEDNRAHKFWGTEPVHVATHDRALPTASRRVSGSDFPSASHLVASPASLYKSI